MLTCMLTVCSNGVNFETFSLGHTNLTTKAKPENQGQLHTILTSFATNKARELPDWVFVYFGLSLVCLSRHPLDYDLLCVLFLAFTGRLGLFVVLLVFVVIKINKLLSISVDL